MTQVRAAVNDFVYPATWVLLTTVAMCVVMPVFFFLWSWAVKLMEAMEQRWFSGKGR